MIILKYIKKIKELLRLSNIHLLSEVHVKILIKFFKLKGGYLRSNKIKGEKLNGKRNYLPPDELVYETHQLHNLVRGVFPMKGSKYALSIQSNPRTKWKLEIDRDHPTLRIKYNFGQNTEYKSDIKQLKNCHLNDIPIGIIFRTAKTKNKILGLGKIFSSNSSYFVIDSYGISQEDSKLLKEETIKEFDKKFLDPELSKIEDVSYSELLPAIEFENEI